ncbi:MAG: lysophospholipase [Candidatus Limnocylindrales bacterium]
MPSTTAAATTRDGVALLTRHWSTAEPPRAAVLLVHGLGEHAGRYEHVGEQLAAAGIETFAWDHRGFGASGGERAWVDRWERFDNDVEDRLAAARSVRPGLPIVVYGHSMGGLIALGYALTERPRPDLLVLSAPGIEDNLAGWKRRAAPILAAIAPHLRVSNGISSAMLSRDAGRQQAADHDPLMLSTSTTQFGALAFAAQPAVRAALQRLDVPTLVIHGLDDPVVPPRATERLGMLPGVTRRAYPGIRHELHNEPEGPAIIADVIAWIDAELAAMDSRSGRQATRTPSPTP